MSDIEPEIEIDDDIPDEPRVSVEDLDKWVAGGNWDQDPDSSPPGAEVETEVEVPAPSPLSPSAVADSDLVRLSDDLALSRAEAKTLYDLSQDLAHNPELAQAIANYYQAKRQPPAAPPPPLPIDLEDPATKWFYDQQQQALSEIQALRSELDTRTGSIAQELQSRKLRENDTVIDRVKTDFAAARNLSPEEVTTLADAAAKLYILPSLLNSGLDLYTATERALDTAYWSNPDFRQRAINTQSEQARTDTTRKRKLAAVGGNSGSSPRTPPVPKNETESRAMMIREVAELMAGDGS